MHMFRSQNMEVGRKENPSHSLSKLNNTEKTKEIKGKLALKWRVYASFAKYLTERVLNAKAEPLKFLENRKAEIENNRQNSKMLSGRDGGPSQEKIRESALKLAREFGWKGGSQKSEPDKSPTGVAPERVQQDKEEIITRIGVPLFISKKAEQEMRSVGITEDELNKLPPEKLWDLFNQRVLEKKMKEPNQKKVYQPEEIKEELVMLNKMWESAYDNMNNVSDTKRVNEVMDLTAKAGDSTEVLEKYIEGNPNLKPEEKFFIEISIQIKKYRAKGKELLHEGTNGKEFI